MNVRDFLGTIYLGDRACRSILIDGWNDEVKIQVTCISRVRGGTWDYYSAEDLPNGFLVFEGATRITFEPPGAIPNDLINGIRVEGEGESSGEHGFVLSIDSVRATGDRTEVTVRVRARGLSLEDVRRPGIRLRE